MKLQTPYRKRILHYCEANGISVPKNFDITQSSESIVAIDPVQEPSALFPRSNHHWKTLLSEIAKCGWSAEQLYYLDFKRGCKLVLKDGRLVRGENFEKRHPEEIRN